MMRQTATAGDQQTTTTGNKPITNLYLQATNRSSNVIHRVAHSSSTFFTSCSLALSFPASPYPSPAHLREGLRRLMTEQLRFPVPDPPCGVPARLLGERELPLVRVGAGKQVRIVVELVVGGGQVAAHCGAEDLGWGGMNQGDLLRIVR